MCSVQVQEEPFSRSPVQQNALSLYNMGLRVQHTLHCTAAINACAHNMQFHAKPVDAMHKHLLYSCTFAVLAVS